MAGKTTDYTITVQTGDKKYAGTDAYIIIALHGEDYQKTENFVLNNAYFRNSFERGQKDEFSLPGKICVGKIESLEFFRDKSGIGDSWFVDVIEVQCRRHGKFVFPIFRWIEADRHYRIPCYDTSLPQYDPYKDQRAMDQQQKRYMYEYHVKSPGLPPTVRTLPEDETFSFDYQFHIGKRKMELKLNKAWQMLTKGEKWKSFDEMSDVYYETFGVPYGKDRWRNDIDFGWQKMNGTNPILISMCREIPEKFGVTDEMLRPLLEGMSVKEAIEGKRLFIIDLEIMDGVTPVSHDIVLPAPIALFFLNGNNELLPVAIQLFQRKSEENPVFLPTDPQNTWLMAKLWFNVADSSFHQSLAHFGYTHILMEGICVAMHRNFSLSHPIFKLLAPHFLYLLAINSRAIQFLISPGGWIDKSMATGVVGLLDLVKKGIDVWRFDINGNFPADLKRRGLDDPNVLPGYYFRDDGLLVFDAIKNYVTEYVKHYYGNPQDIIDDWELQGFGNEVSKRWEQGGCGVKGMPNNGNFTSIDDVISVFTGIIFTCSAMHGAVNFAQYSEYGFPPNYPAKILGNPPKNKEPLTESDILGAIADRETTIDVMIITNILSEKATRSLGDFEVNYIHDPPAVKILERFREELTRISAIIKERNKTRRHPYLWLDPENVPNAISI